MSSYWDAIERTARGMPGSAQPRRRTLFEDYRHGELESPYEIDLEIDAQGVPVRSEAPAIELPDKIPLVSSPVRRDGEMVNDTTGAMPAPTSPDDVGRQEREPVPEIAADDQAETDTPARQIEAPAPPTPVTRIVEHHEVETSRVLIERQIEPHAQVSSPGPEHEVLASAQPAVEPASEAPSTVSPKPALVIPGQPIVREERPSSTSAPAETPPVIIEIDRIDVRIEHTLATPVVPVIRRPVGNAPALHDYLASRSGVRP